MFLKLPKLPNLISVSLISDNVYFIKDVYKTGVKLTKKVMQTYENLIHRLPGLEKWFVSVPFYED